MLSSYVKKLGTHSPPPPIRIITPLQTFPGCDDVETIRDLWWHPLMGEKWAPHVKQMDLLPMPMEYVQEGPVCPRVELRGLAIFTINTNMARQLAKVVRPEAPLFEVEDLPSYLLDFPSDSIERAYNIINNKDFGSTRFSQLRRSPSSTDDNRRLQVEIRFPRGTSVLDMEMAMRQLRRGTLPRDFTYGAKGLFADRTALIMETNHPMAAIKAWECCSGMVFINNEKILLHTDLEAEQWTNTMDRLMNEDPAAAILKLKWRCSRMGGRPFASPSLHNQQNAAVRNTKGGTARMDGRLRDVTDIQLVGMPSQDEADIMRQLMDHLANASGIQLKEAIGQQSGQGTWRRANELDPTAPAGRVRLHLSSEDEAKKIHQLLHGRSIKVGADFIGVQVMNDAATVRRLQERQGNGRGAGR